MQKGWFRSRPNVTHNTSHNAENKPLFMWTPPCACMYIDNMDTGHSLVSTDSRTGIATFRPWLHTWVENKIWSFVAFCASAVCSRSGTGVKQTHLMQKNEVTHQQVRRLPWVKTCAGGRSRGGGGTGISGKQWFAKMQNTMIYLGGGGGTCSTRLTGVPGWSVMREVDKGRHRRRTINHFVNISFVLLPARVSDAAVAHLSVLQGLSCDLQQPCIYGVTHNLWQFHPYNKVLRQRRSLFSHSDLRGGCFPSRITSLISIIVKHTPL